MAFLVVDVEQRDLGAVCDEMLRDGEAESGGTAGDDGLDLIELHGILFRWKAKPRILTDAAAGPSQSTVRRKSRS